MHYGRKKRNWAALTAVLALLALMLLLVLNRVAAPDPPAQPSWRPDQEAAPGPEPSLPPPAELSDPALAPHPAQGLEISEVMPANESFLPDGSGAFSDWVELYNPTASPISLGGLFLSDRETELRRFPLPDRVLDAGERFLLFCGGDDPANAAFSLDKKGESLYLSTEDGRILSRVSYGETEANASVCFSGGEGELCLFPTPGYPNDEQGYEDFLRSADRPGPLVIQEIVSYNTDYKDRWGQYPDWIELKNVSEEPVFLGDYALSQNAEEPFACPLPEETLQPGELYMVFCSGEQGQTAPGSCSVGFKLSCGESVFLSRRDEGLSDYLRLPRVPGSGSYGRMEDRSGFFYFEKRTPKAPNGEGFRRISQAPAADLAQGVYEGVDSLTLCLSAPGTIYYSLDGSVPDKNDAVYTGPLSITKTTVVRAVACQEGRLTSPCVTLSYIVNEGHSLPVVSVATDPQDFYQVRTDFNDLDREYSTAAAFFDPAGQGQVFAADCSIKLHGAGSRVLSKQSFKLVFRDRYGGDIVCDPFGRGEENEYHALLLRGGIVQDMYILKDCLCSLAAIEAAEEPLALDSRYCVLYVNGGYYGIYALREAYCRQYGAVHTGCSKDSVEIARYNDEVILQELIDFVRTHPLQDDENFEALGDRLDLDSFASWLALEIYFGNVDPSCNIRYIRSEGTGGKWRVAFFDLDMSLYDKTFDYRYYYFNKVYEFAILARELCGREEFRQLLLENAARLYRGGLGAELMERQLTVLCSQLDPEMLRNCVRWNEDYTLWGYGCEHLRSLVGDQRTLGWIQSIQTISQASDEELEAAFGDLSALRQRAAG